LNIFDVGAIDLWDGGDTLCGFLDQRIDGLVPLKPDVGGDPHDDLIPPHAVVEIRTASILRNPGLVCSTRDRAGKS